MAGRELTQEEFIEWDRRREEFRIACLKKRPEVKFDMEELRTVLSDMPHTVRDRVYSVLGVSEDGTPLRQNTGSIPNSRIS